jgi:hypothetical protein
VADTETKVITASPRSWVNADALLQAATALATPSKVEAVSPVFDLKIASQPLFLISSILATAGYGGGGQNSHSYQGAQSGGISKLSCLSGPEFLTI